VGAGFSDVAGEAEEVSEDALGRMIDRETERLKHVSALNRELVRRHLEGEEHELLTDERASRAAQDAVMAEDYIDPLRAVRPRSSFRELDPSLWPWCVAGAVLGAVISVVTVLVVHILR
jgi:hypothetical protein